VLVATALGRRFGGLVAVDDVSLSLAPRTVHAVIRPERRRQVDLGQPALRRAAAIDRL
jgi:hypothetical protein